MVSRACQSLTNTGLERGPDTTIGHVYSKGGYGRVGARERESEGMSGWDEGTMERAEHNEGQCMGTT